VSVRTFQIRRNKKGKTSFSSASRVTPAFRGQYGRPKRAPWLTRTWLRVLIRVVRFCLPNVFLVRGQISQNGRSHLNVHSSKEHHHVFPHCNVFPALAVVTARSCLAQAIGSVPVTIVNPADIAKVQGIHHPFQAVLPARRSIHVACHGDLTVVRNAWLSNMFLFPAPWKTVGSTSAACRSLRKSEGLTKPIP
jgi:hypothetical protein